MSLQRASRLPHFLRPVTTRSTLTSLRYATSTKNQPGQNVEGESGKSPDQAEPKLYSKSPPKEEEAPQDVQEHNKNVNQRFDRPNEKVKDEDIEKDKVSKGFWSGM